MWKILLPFLMYLYYCFFIAYSAITSTSSCISFIYNCAIQPGRAVTSIFTLDWARVPGIPWLGRATPPTPLAPNLTAFSFCFIFGVLAYQLCGDMV